MKTTDNFADLTLTIKWNTVKSSHRDVFHLRRVNIFRDFLYEDEPEILFDLEKGDIVYAEPKLLKKYFKYKNSNIIKISRLEIKPLKPGENPIYPKKGRFYPKGILSGVSDVFSANMHPFRCLGVNKEHIYCDFNNPLSGKDPEIEIRIDDIIKKDRDTGSSCRHLLEETITGPGMQSRFNDRPTDFFSQDPFKRSIDISDEEFYEQPRITAHADALCRKHISMIYSELIKPDKKVLDLMASVYSHLPDDKYLDVTGLGMNMTELNENKIFSRRIVQDINNDLKLPFDERTFNYVICSLSVEYLTNPFKIFEEVYRILRKDGLFIITFSNRWFPGKEIKIWNELHDFEKMGLVSEYFFGTKGFTDLKTLSLRGFPRPYDKNDRYRDSLWFSDPLFAVWAKKE